MWTTLGLGGISLLKYYITSKSFTGKLMNFRVYNYTALNTHLWVFNKEHIQKGMPPTSSNKFYRLRSLSDNPVYSIVFFINWPLLPKVTIFSCIPRYFFLLLHTIIAHSFFPPIFPLSSRHSVEKNERGHMDTQLLWAFCQLHKLLTTLTSNCWVHEFPSSGNVMSELYSFYQSEFSCFNSCLLTLQLAFLDNSFWIIHILDHSSIRDFKLPYF